MGDMFLAGVASRYLLNRIIYVFFHRYFKNPSANQYLEGLLNMFEGIGSYENNNQDERIVNKVDLNKAQDESLIEIISFGTVFDLYVYVYIGCKK